MAQVGPSRAALRSKGGMTIGLEKHPLPDGWAETLLLDVVSHRSGNSKLIKGKLYNTAGPQLVPAYSASGKDVWCEDAEHDGDEGPVISDSEHSRE